MRKINGFIILFFLLWFICRGIQAISITVTGSWSETIDASDLQAGAGSDLINSYESTPNSALVEIKGAGQKNWRVDIRKMDINWHTDFRLYVRRTGDGSGSGSISGGISYQEVTDFDQAFFDGARNRSDIPIQLRLTDVSVQIPPNTYSTEVWYTVVDI